jgi:hypothetical protein
VWAPLVTLVNSAGAVPIPYFALRAASAALIRLPAAEAEGQVTWTCPSPQVTGERLVSFLVSFMYVYLRPSPSTTAL